MEKAQSKRRSSHHGDDSASATSDTSNAALSMDSNSGASAASGGGSAKDEHQDVNTSEAREETRGTADDAVSSEYNVGDFVGVMRDPGAFLAQV